MSRTSSSLAQSLPNETQETQSSEFEEDAHHSMHWATDTEDLYMASIEYGEDMGITKNSELQGKEVLKHMGLSAMQGEAKATKANYYQLFSFKNPGLVSFDIQGLLEDNDLDLGVKIEFGPFGTPTKRIRLVNVVEQFQIVLAAMPFVSESSKRKALDALRDFGSKDVSSVVSKVPPPGLTPGSTIALQGQTHRRFLRMNSQSDMDASGPRDDFPFEWTWERFTVVDAGNGEIALHNTWHNRFVRMNTDGMDASAVKAASDLPAGWSWERFTVVYGGNGTIALHSRIHNRFVEVSDLGVAFRSITKDASDLPAAMIFARFRVLQVKPFLEPGSVVGLHCARWNRFLRMNDQADMDFSAHKAADQMPWDWSWERFTVVDAGNGQIALHSAYHNRFVRMNHAGMDASAHKAASDLPKEWGWEPFVVRYLANGEIALHNTFFNRFVRMTDLVVDSSDPVNLQDYPATATDWKFKIVKLADAPTEANDDPWSFEVD
eukprot:s810_g13.t1